MGASTIPMRQMSERSGMESQKKGRGALRRCGGGDVFADMTSPSKATLIPTPDRRSVLGGLAGLALAPTAARAAGNDGSTLSFLAVGDWGRDGSRQQTRVAAAMAEAA